MVKQDRFIGQFLKGKPKTLKNSKPIGEELQTITLQHISRNGRILPRRGAI